MEQKRILWIVLASGIFLLVVTGAALLYVLTSRSAAPSGVNSSTVWTATPTLSSNANQQSSEPYAQGIASVTTTSTDTGRNDSWEKVQGEPTDSQAAEGDAAVTQTENLTVIANGTTNVYSTGTTTIDLNALKSGTTSSVTAQNAAAQEAIARTEQNAPAASTPAASTPAASTPAATTTSAKTTTTTTSTKTASTTSTGSASSKKTSSASSSSKTTSTAVADRFWVQAASYSSKKNADEARELLDKNGIQCEVFTFTDSKGTLFYRVRVGPYTTKSEAEYWKQQIDAIELFAKAGTYITNSSAPAVAKK